MFLQVASLLGSRSNSVVLGSSCPGTSVLCPAVEPLRPPRPNRGQGAACVIVVGACHNQPIVLLRTRRTRRTADAAEEAADAAADAAAAGRVVAPAAPDKMKPPPPVALDYAPLRYM